MSLEETTKKDLAGEINEFISTMRRVNGRNIIALFQHRGNYTEDQIKVALNGLSEQELIFELYSKGTPSEQQIPENAYYVSRPA